MAKRGKNKRDFLIIIGIIILVIVLVLVLRPYLIGRALEEPTPEEPLPAPTPASVKDSDGRAVSPKYAAAFTPGCTDLFKYASCNEKIGVVGDECTDFSLIGGPPLSLIEKYATKTSFIFFESTCAPGACCTWAREEKVSCSEKCRVLCYNELGRPTGSYDPCAKADGYCTFDDDFCKDQTGKGVDSAHCECKGWTRPKPSSSPSPSP